jgi:hypothetical protein
VGTVLPYDLKPNSWQRYAEYWRQLTKTHMQGKRGLAFERGVDFDVSPRVFAVCARRAVQKRGLPARVHVRGDKVFVVFDDKK